MQPTSKKTYIAAVLLAAAAFLFAAASAFADSYQVTVVKYSQSQDFYGIDTAGDFVVNVSNSLSYANNMACGSSTNATSCFETWYQGQSNPVFSTAAPSLSYDDGAACSSSINGAAVAGTCNSGYQLLGGNDVNGIWIDGNGSQFFMNGTFSGGFINSVGDAVFVDSANDSLVSVLNEPSPAVQSRPALVVAPAPVPEPASFMLFGTGCAAMGGVLRRRLRA